VLSARLVAFTQRLSGDHCHDHHGVQRSRLQTKRIVTALNPRELGSNHKLTGGDYKLSLQRWSTSSKIPLLQDVIQDVRVVASGSRLTNLGLSLGGGFGHPLDKRGLVRYHPAVGGLWWDSLRWGALEQLLGFLGLLSRDRIS
jgi:hypothetical protein